MPDIFLTLLHRKYDISLPPELGIRMEDGCVATAMGWGTSRNLGDALPTFLVPYLARSRDFDERVLKYQNGLWIYTPI